MGLPVERTRLDLEIPVSLCLLSTVLPVYKAGFEPAMALIFL